MSNEAGGGCVSHLWPVGKTGPRVPCEKWQGSGSLLSISILNKVTLRETLLIGGF